MTKYEKTTVFRKIVKFICVISLVSIAIFLMFFFWFLFFLLIPRPSESLLEHGVLRNKRVASVKILESEMDLPFYKHDIEIQTKNGYLILLHDVRWTLRTTEIRIDQINDIGSFGGRVYRIPKERMIWYYPNEITILEKMLGIKLKSVNDIINHVDELYELYKFIEAKSETEFVYKDKFIIDADFRKMGEDNSEEIIHD